MSASAGRRAIEPIGHDLTERDIALVRAVRDHRFMTARQIERLLFNDHSTTEAGARICRRVLARLTRDRLLARLQRRVGGVRAGSASYVYALGSAGGRILDGTRNRMTEPSSLFLDHTLAIADARLALETAARERLFDLVEVEIEPASWRGYSGAGGAPATVKPDLYVVTGREDFEDCWFFEIDRGTESPAAISRKCRAYDLYWRSGLEQAAHDTFPRVVWVAPDERRADRIRTVIKRARNLNQELFRVTTSPQLVENVAEGAA
jgi:hypothetical protein